MHPEHNISPMTVLKFVIKGGGGREQGEGERKRRRERGGGRERGSGEKKEGEREIHLYQ